MTNTTFALNQCLSMIALLSILVVGTIASKDLAKCAVEIMDQSFEDRNLNAITFKYGDDDEIIDEILREYNETLFIKTDNWSNFSVNVVVSNFIVIANKVSDLVKIHGLMNETVCDNTGRFIIMGSNITVGDVKRIFDFCWKNRIVNAVLLVLNSDRVDVYTYFPFSLNWCREVHPVLLDSWQSGVGFLKNASKFPEKLESLHNCTILVSSFEQPPFMYIKKSQFYGFEGDLIKLMGDILKFRVELIAPEDGWGCGRSLNRTWVGCLGQAYSRQSDICLCAAEITLTRYNKFQLTQQYYTKELVWILRRPSKEPSWSKLIYPLSFEAWIAVMLIYVVIVLLLWYVSSNIMSKFLEDTLRVGRIRSGTLIINSWLVFTGQTMTVMPRFTFFRFNLMSWMILCFFLRNAYQTNLYKILNMDIYETYYNTLEDLLEAGFKLGGISPSRSYFRNNTAVYSHLDQFNITGDEVYDKIKEISTNDEKFAFLASKEIALMYLKDHNGSRSITILKEKAVSLPQGMYLKRFSPLAKSINKATLRVVQAGFVDHFAEKYFGKKYVRQVIKTNRESKKLYTIEMEHLYGCFLILICGIGFSVVAFIGEVLI